MLPYIVLGKDTSSRKPGRTSMPASSSKSDVKWTPPTKEGAETFMKVSVHVLGVHFLC